MSQPRSALRPKKRIPSHPGEILREEFLKPLGVTQVEFAAHLGVPLQRVNEIVRGKRGISPETAGALGTTPEFWINLQAAHDLAISRRLDPCAGCAGRRESAAARSKAPRGWGWLTTPSRAAHTPPLVPTLGIDYPARDGTNVQP